MERKKIMLSAIVAVTALLSQQVNAQDTTMGNKKKMGMDTMPVVKENMPMSKDKMQMTKDTVPMGKGKMPMEKDMMSMSGDSISKEKDNMAMGKDKMPMHNGMMPDLKSWPEASQMAVKEITDKYGKADVMGDEVFMWMNKGPWKVIYINKKESKHSFPIEHTDMMMQSVSYKVPTEKYDDLGKFDGSITVDRTQGLLSARCDKEGNNILALNLAHDIIIGKKTVEQARKAYGDIVKVKMNGGNPVYMHHLTFENKTNTADADINTTGLTKDDVMKGGKENIKKSTVSQ